MAEGARDNILDHIRRVISSRTAIHLSDGQLLERFVAAADDAAFAALVQRHGGMVLGLCQRVLNHRQDAEDAFQATFLVLARKAGSVSKRESVGSWLYATASHMAVKMKTQKARQRAYEMRAASPTEAVAAPEPVWGELRPVLDEELRRLPERYLAPLVLCYLEGKTNEEAAQQLQWPSGTVKSRLARGRDLLRVRLARRGSAFSAGSFAAILIENGASAAVSSQLVDATVQAARHFGLGSAAAVGASARVWDLAADAVQTIGMGKVRVAVVALLAVTLIGGGIGWFASRPAGDRTRAAEPPTTDRAQAPLTQFRDRENVLSLAFVPQSGGRTLALGSLEGSIALWDLTTPAEKVRFRAGGTNARLVLSPDGRILASLARMVPSNPEGRDEMVLWDMTTRREIGRFQAKRHPMAVAFTADGKAAALAEQFDAEGVQLIETATAKSLTRVRLDQSLKVPDGLFTLAFAPGGKTFAAGFERGAIALLDLAPRQSPRLLHGRRAAWGTIRSLAFAPDGKTLLAHDRQFAAIWNVANGGEVRELEVGKDAISSNMVFDSSGKRAAAGTKGGGVCLWDVSSGKIIHRFGKHPRPVTSVMFSPDGNRLASAAGDPIVRFWEMPRADGR